MSLKTADKPVTNKNQWHGTAAIQRFHYFLNITKTKRNNLLY